VGGADLFGALSRDDMGTGEEAGMSRLYDRASLSSLATGTSTDVKSV
jgi:hypothetical protein